MAVVPGGAGEDVVAGFGRGSGAPPITITPNSTTVLLCKSPLTTSATVFLLAGTGFLL